MKSEKTMLGKIHFRLTFLFSAITTVILVIMSCATLYISEKGLKNNSFVSFQNDIRTIISNLEQQTVITRQWLSKTEAHGKYRIRLLDNGIPVFFNRQNSPETLELFDQAWETYEKHVQNRPEESDSFVSHTEFTFHSSGRDSSDFYACAGFLRRNSGNLQILILMPLDLLHRQILQQRLLFILLTVLAAFCLMVFSMYFTKKLLQPIDDAQKRQNRFIADASHELRTPLAVILSCISACKDAEPAKQSQLLNAISSEGLRMSHLIDDLLLLTRADNRTWTIKTAPAEADTLLLNVYEAFEPLAAQKELQLDIRLPDLLLPPCCCDCERIQQALSILLHNAVSYTPKHGTIVLSLSFDSKNFRFQVADNGIGIPDEEKAHVFERFYRADKSRCQKDHFGLGLSIAAEIVDIHHGQLLLEDTPGGGSTFAILLPA